MKNLLNSLLNRSFLAKTLIVLMIFTMSMPNITAFAAADNTINAYGYNINNKFEGNWSKGNLGPTFEEGEWVAFQTEVISVDWENLTNLGVRFDFYDSDAVFYDLVRNISVGTTLLPDDHGYPDITGDPYSITSEASANTAQREPEEYIFDEFNKIDVPNDQINRATDLGTGTFTDNSRTFFVKKDQIVAALDLAPEESLPTDIVLYFQLHLSRTWIWNNTADDFALAKAYSQPPTNAWGGYIYNDASFLPKFMTALGSSAYPGSSGHSYVFINDGDSGEKTIPVPNVGETAGVISGHKYLDSNGNGVFDEGESPLAGWEIFLRTDLYALDDIEFSTMTDEFGYYEFSDLPYNLIWELTEIQETDYVQTHPKDSTSGEGTFTTTPNPETDHWKVPFDVDSTYDGDNRAPKGWSVKLAPNGFLNQENVDFMNVNNGDLLITKQFNAEDASYPEWIEVQVTGPSYPGPDGTTVRIDINTETGYGEELLTNLLPGEYTVTEVVLSDGNNERWDPVIVSSPVQVDAGQIDPPAEVNIENNYIVFSGQIDGNKLDEDELPLDDPVFEFEIYSTDDLVNPIAYAESSGILGNFNFGETAALIDQDTLTLEEGSYIIREVNLPPGYEYVKMIVIDGSNDPVEYTTVDVPFTIVAQDQLINFDVVNALIPGALIIEKTFVDGGDNIPPEITVQVTYEDASVYNEEHVITITDGYGMAEISDLVPGMYYFNETSLNENWTVTYDPADQMIEVLPGGTSEAQSVSIENEIVPGALIIEKTFVDGGDNIPPEITVQVTYEDASVYNEEHVITITDGYGMADISDLVPGMYYFNETSLDENWTVTYDPTDQMIEVLPGGTSEAQSVSIENEIVPGALIIEKTFVDGGDNIPPEITVQVTYEDASVYNEEHVITITDGYGMADISDLVPGMYYFNETSLDENWTVTYDPADQMIEVLPGGTSEAQSVSIENEIVPGALIIEKTFVDGGDNIPPEITVQVTYEDASVYNEEHVITITDGYGMADISDLIPGMYYFNETSLDENWTVTYDPADQMIEVLPGGTSEAQSVSIENEIVPGALIIEKTFVDGGDNIPPEITVQVTYEDASVYNEEHVITITDGYGMAEISDLVPGMYYFNETSLDENWTVTYDPADQMIEVLPGGTSEAQSVSIENEIVPGALIIEKTFVDGGEYIPPEITVQVTYEDASVYNEEHVITITDGYGMAEISDLVPGMYYFNETSLDENWTVTYDPADQMIEVLPGGTSEAQSVSISNEIVPGNLMITKEFMGGEDYPDEISVYITGPEEFDDIFIISIDGNGYGEITLTELVPGMYEVFELEFDGSELWTSEIDASPIEVMPGQTDPAALVEITNYRRMVEETAFAYPAGDGGELRDVVRKGNNWGWYIDASEDMIGESYDVYAAAGQNDISKGKLVGTVTFTNNNGYYEANFELDPDIFGISVTDGPHFGVYESPEDIPNAPGKYSNDVPITEATAIVFHVVVEYPME